MGGADGYLKKGRQVYVEGRLQTRPWEDRDGVQRIAVEVIAQVVQFLGAAPGEPAAAVPSKPPVELDAPPPTDQEAPAPQDEPVPF